MLFAPLFILKLSWALAHVFGCRECFPKDSIRFYWALTFVFGLLMQNLANLLSCYPSSTLSASGMKNFKTFALFQFFVERVREQVIAALPTRRNTANISGGDIGPLAISFFLLHGQKYLSNFISQKGASEHLAQY